MFRPHEGAVLQEETFFLSNQCSHMSLNPCCHGHGHECRIVFSCAMAVVPCFVVVDLPVRKVFLLQAVHRIAAWLGPESAVLRGRTFLVYLCLFVVPDA